MALITIDSISRQDKDKYRIHEIIEGSYTFFEIDGRKFLQIETYGSKNRKTLNKQSQVIQIDQDTALFLFDQFLHEGMIRKYTKK